MVHPRSFENHLCKLDERIAKYSASTDSRENVALIGSSYVSMLGDDSAIYNLGLHSACPSEYSALASLCRKHDVVLCAVTIRDIAVLQGRGILGDRNRLPVRNSLWRELSILRGIVRYQSGLFELPATASTVTSYDIQEVERYLGEGVSRRVASGVARQCLGFPVDAQNVSLKVFEKIYAKHPNIIFILFPSCPFIRPPNTNSLIKERITSFIDTEIALREALAQSNLPYIELSLEPSGYQDSWHYNAHGTASIWRQLEALFCQQA